MQDLSVIAGPGYSARGNHHFGTVLTYGTFDLFHIGHLNLLRRLRAMCDRLLVGVSTDEFNEAKQKHAIFPYEYRAEIVASVRYVDDVFLEESWEQKRDDVLRHSADAIAMGADWSGRFDDLADVCSIVYLPRTDGVSSSELKQRMRALGLADVKRIQEALSIAAEVLDALS